MLLQIYDVHSLLKYKTEPLEDATILEIWWALGGLAPSSGHGHLYWKAKHSSMVAQPSSYLKPFGQSSNMLRGRVTAMGYPIPW